MNQHNILTDADSLVADLSIAVFRTTPDGSIAGGNAALARLFGAESVEDLVDVDVRSLYANPADREYMMTRVAAREEIAPEEVELQRLDGQRIWVRVSSSGVFDDDGNVLFYQGVLEDVTAGRRTDIELVRSNALLDTLTDVQNRFIAGGDAGVLFDQLLEDLLTITSSDYGFIAQVLHHGDGSPFVRSWAMSNIAWNEETRQMFAMHGPRGMEFHNLDTLFGRAVTDKTAVISNDPFNDPRKGGRPAGHPPLDSFLGLPILKGDEVVGLIAVSNRPGGYDEALVQYLQPLVATVGSMIEAIRSEEARHAAEARERSREELARAVVEHAPDAVVAFRDDGTIEAFNPAAEAMTGFSESDMIGRSVAELVPEQHLEAYRRRALARTESTTELLVRGRGGELVPAEVSFGRSDIGERTIITAVVRNIAERKAFEDALLEARDAAERTSRAKDEFLAAMSHELRTPLNAVIGLSTILGRETHGPVNPKQGEYLEQIESAGRHLLELINDILDLAKIEADELEPEATVVDMRSLVASAVTVVREQALAKGLRLEVECCEDLPQVFADARRTKQVLLNLLANAIKFTEPGGSVGVRGQIAGDQLAIVVWDSGIGIPSENLDDIFAPFKQLDHSLARTHEGTGLGLALTAKLIEAQGGSIRVESEVGAGSEFTFTLPLAADPDRSDSETSTNSPGSRESEALKPRILVVEDNPVNRMMVTDYLEAEGYATEVASDGGQVDRVVREFRPDVILMDVQLPHRDGLSVTRALKADPATSAIPVIALTALAMKGDAERCLEAGCDGYLSKPCDPADVVAAIEHALTSTGVA